MAKPPNQIVGNAGLYYVCYELTKLGWNVLPTSRNARGVDLVIYNEDATQTHTLQVKALSELDAVPLGPSLDHLIAEYLVVCTHVMTVKPAAFVMHTSDVIAQAHLDGQPPKASYWLEPKSYKGHPAGWDLIGTTKALEQ
jgi:hypothetical protein